MEIFGIIDNVTRQQKTIPKVDREADGFENGGMLE